MSGQIRTILQWPGSFEHYRKLPTCESLPRAGPNSVMQLNRETPTGIVYHQASPQHEAQIVAWGLEAKTATVREGYYKLEWFKLFLDPAVLREGRMSSTARLPGVLRQSSVSSAGVSTGALS